VPESPVYLDYLATTPVDPQVVDVMVQYLKEDFGNPTSSHFFGEGPKKAIALARKQIADMLGADSPSEIIFTSGGSESNSLAIVGGLKALRSTKPERDHIITSQIEHPAVINTLKDLSGYRITILPVDNTGLISLSELRAAIEPEKTAMVTIMLANNEVGTIQPLKEISQICHEHDILVHSDGAQAIGKIPVNVNDIGVDLLSLAGHKFYGPKGIGAVYCRSGFRPHPIICGANQEDGIRSGTSNVSGIAGMGKAAELARLDLEAGHHNDIKVMRNWLENALKERFPDAAVNGNSEIRLPLICSIGFPGIVGFELLKALSSKVCFSAGAACNTGHGSPTLNAMKVPADIAKGTIRLSLGRFTTQKQLDIALGELTDGITALRAKSG